MKKSLINKIEEIKKWCDTVHHRGFHRGFWMGSLLTAIGIVTVAYLVERFLR